MKTKIVATIGPASEHEMMLREMMLHGMNVARLNFSHGSHEEHRERIRRIRLASEMTRKTVAIILDTKGPEIRVANDKQSVHVMAGEDYILGEKSISSKEKEYYIPLTYNGIGKDVEIGSRVLIDDGKISMRVISIGDTFVICRGEVGGVILPNKGVNLPGREVGLPAFTQKDQEDLLFGIQEKVDFIAASFIRNGNHVKEMKKFIAAHNSTIPIIAKIESREGIDHLEEILQEADGLMVARGDLGVEIPLWEVPLVQKKMIALSNRYGKPVITATQMLDSMIENPIPTRAEVSDVANAILDGTDGVMLSGESAAGKYPLAAVKAMAEIGEAAEKGLNHEKFFNEEKIKGDVRVSLSHAAVSLANTMNAKAIIVPTITGATPKTVSSLRPKIPMIVTSPSKEVCRHLSLIWGIDCIYSSYSDDVKSMVHYGIEQGKALGIIKSGDDVVVAAGLPLGFGEKTNGIIAVKVD